MEPKMTGTEFSLSNNSLWSLRQSGFLADWKVTVKDASDSERTYPVHSPVLAQHSEFFRLLFDSSGSGWKENTSREVTVTLPGDATADAFPFVLDFCYSDAQHCVAIPERQWVRVGAIAEQLQMTALKAQLLEKFEQVRNSDRPHEIDESVLGELFLDTLDPALAVPKDLLDAVHSCMVFYVAICEMSFTGVCAANRTCLSDKDVVTALLRVWEDASVICAHSTASAVGVYILEHRATVVSSGLGPEVMAYLDVSNNTISMWMLALQLGAASVVSRCLYAATHEFDQWDIDVWKKLPREQLAALLSSKSLHVDSEDSVLDALLLWLENNEATPEETNAMLISCVDYSFVSCEHVLKASRQTNSPTLLKHILERRVAVEARQLTAQPLHTQVWEFDKASTFRMETEFRGARTVFRGRYFHAVSAVCRPCGSARITITPRPRTYVGVIPSAAVALATSHTRLSAERLGVALHVADGRITVLDKVHQQQLFPSPLTPFASVEIDVAWNQTSVTFSCGGHAVSVDDDCFSRGIFVANSLNNNHSEVKGALAPRSTDSDSEDEASEEDEMSDDV